MKIMDFNPKPNCAHRLKFKKCEFDACAMTTNPQEADILMFNAVNMKDLIVPKRPIGQIWLLYTREPITDRRMQYLNQSSYHGQFNWTRTYFSDSTFLSIYGLLIPRKRPQKDYEQIYHRKKYDVAWFVSKCSTSSRREDYVHRMSKFVQVHVYGGCGNFSCGSGGFDMGGSRDECLHKLSEEYKFYLSFENSFCRDYVTEKFFNVFPDIDVIPVVRGGAVYERLSTLDTYINAKDFASPEKLGRYLQELSRNKTQYLKMLQKKDEYDKIFPQHNAGCELCQAAHSRSPRHVFDDVYSWLTRPGNCWPPDDLSTN
ncbi:glycoprotein 3-alpha-L-fucosyltransferase A-like isoform X3 [Biomphalaria glabrata]|nr:glycoprotein 3-alpha-L-fucosyltransferase A-like isoform X3 [Biomphalaria glabrata]XP_055890811.1 glycoprotein 3-alpha-L-fucosyltransferase A-like isoform X3 [Biomphalaria glabrata]